MLKIILNRLKPQVEKTIAEEQADFRAGRSTTEETFNLQILCEKYLQHLQDLYHVFLDFKKAFNRVWYAALWATMKTTKQTEEEVGRQHQGVDKPGVHQVPEGSGEQGKMEETGCEIICCAPMTVMFKG